MYDGVPSELPFAAVAIVVVVADVAVAATRLLRALVSSTRPVLPHGVLELRPETFVGLAFLT